VREFSWLDKLFPTLKAGAPKSKLWPFNYYDLCKQIKKAAGNMQVSFVPYQLRHSGTPLEVHKRGAWRTTTSLVRYEKHGKMISEYERIPLGTRGWLENCHLDSEETFLREKPVCDPPSVA